MSIDLGFEVKKSDARKDDVVFRKPEGGVAGKTTNGIIEPGVKAMLFALAVELSEKDDTYPNRNAAEAAVFGQFWREWKALP